MSLGMRLKKAREAANMTQEVVAMQIQVSKNAVSLWEKNDSSLTLTNLAKIAKLYGVTTDWLLLGVEIPAPQKPSSNSDNNDDHLLSALKTLWASLVDEQKLDLINHAKYKKQYNEKIVAHFANRSSSPVK